jgi:membrane protein
MRRALDRVFRFYWGEGIADDVPALAYYLVLSLAPFALGVAAVALRLDDALTALTVAEQINRYLPAQVHGDVERLVVGTRESSPELLIVAIVAMLWTTSGAIGVIERCISRMLGGERHHIVLGRIRNMVLGAVVAAGVILAAIGTSAVNDIPFLGRSASPGLLLVMTSLGSIALFAAIYRYAPRAHLGWRSGLLGAVPAGIGLQIVPSVVGLYVNAVAGFQAVRLFLVLAVVLLAVSLLATLVLVGAGIAAYAERRARAAARRARPAVTAAAPQATDPERAPARAPS